MFNTWIPDGKICWIRPSIERNGLPCVLWTKVLGKNIQPVDVDITCLAYPMAPVLSLCIHRRIPVRVIEDDRVSTRQVDADTSGPRRQDEAEYPLVCVEPFHQHLPLLHLKMTTKHSYTRICYLSALRRYWLGDVKSIWPVKVSESVVA